MTELPAPDLALANARLHARLLVSVIVVALCAIVYELTIATVGSYFLGHTVLQFSLTIGVFLTALGVGAAAYQLARDPGVTTFVAVELAVGLLGGFGMPFLFYAYGEQPGLFAACLYGYTLVLGTLLGIELPLAAELLGGRRGLGPAVSRLLSLDYLGSLAGSLVFPLFLLPVLGLLRTGLCMGLLNVGVAVWLGSSLRGAPGELIGRQGSRAKGPTSPGIEAGSDARAIGAKRRRGQGVVLIGLGAAAALVGGLLVSGPLADSLSQRLYRDPIILSVQTAYQTVTVTRLHDDVRLFLDGQLQFSSLDEYRYHEALVHPAMSLASSRDTVLVLGGGDGLAVRRILQYADVSSVTLVELDPEVIRLFRDQPLLRDLNGGVLSDRRVHVVTEDAVVYLQKTPDVFDVVIADFPDPRDPSLERLYTTEFYELVRRHMASGGAFVTQATSPFFAPQAFWSIEATAQSVWPHARGYHIDVPSFGDWGFVLASNAEITPERLAPSVPTRYLTPDVLAASFTFGVDVLASREGVGPNSLVRPVLAGYYGQGWRR